MAFGKVCHVSLNVISTLIFLLAASSSVYNLVQLAGKEGYTSFSFSFDYTVTNYKLGIIVQCAMIAIFCLLAAIHEIAAMFNTTLFPFMNQDIGRAIVHAIVACLSFGFCGGYGLIIEIIELFIALLCFATSTIEAWNPVDIDSGSGGDFDS